MEQMCTPLHEEHNGKSHIKVYLRTRPLLEKEILDGAFNILRVIPVENKVLVEEGSKGCFIFDGVCDENESQEEVFNKVLLHPLENLKNFKNVNIIAYGQTGSGKTFTIGTNPVYSQKNGGMLQRVMSSLLQNNLVDNSFGTKFLKMTFLEIYNENIYDLFASRKVLETKADGLGGVVPLNCKEEIVLTPEQGLKLLETGNALRSVAPTVMNAHSSRSHALISFTLYETLENGIEVTKGCLRMVDLAGAEGVGRNNTKRKNFCEGVSINKGLLAVGKVLAALSSNNASLHIPYRESIITRLLRDALSGADCYTSMIICVSPASTNLSVTLNTLRYAEQAKNIKPNHRVSTVKKKGSLKRRLDDLSANPVAWKRFASGKKRTPSHNSTISTPGHKPSVRKIQPFNSTFVTPCNRVNDFLRPFPRSSSRTDLKSITEFSSFKQPTFDDEISPTNSVIQAPTVNTTLLQMSPLVEKMNSQFELSILKYEQRIENKMKYMENKLAKKVAKIIIKGTTSKRRSKRLMRKNGKSGILSPSGVEMTPNFTFDSSNDENNLSTSNNSEESSFSLADSIAEALLKKKRFQSALKVAVKEEKEVNSAEGFFAQNEKHARLPLAVISNVNDGSINKGYTQKRSLLEERAAPVTSTLACNDKIVRRSTRLSCINTPRGCFFSPALNVSKDRSCLKDETCNNFDKQSRANVTVLLTNDYITSASPVLPNNEVIHNKAEQTSDVSLKLSPSTSIATKRHPTRKSALNASKAIKANCEVLASTKSPFTNASRRKSRQSGSKGLNRSLNSSVYFAGLKTPMKCKENLELTVNFSVQKEHNDHILHLLNNADLRKLQTLPTVGPKTAMVIYNFRKMFGKMKTVEDLQNVPGLPKSFYSRFIKANLVLR